MENNMEPGNRTHERSLTTLEGTGAVQPLPTLVREFVRASKAENTIRGYQADWRHFCQWCESRGIRPLPAAPETVAAYIAECAGYLKVGSIQRRLNAIAEAHKATGMESPIHAGIVKNTMKGIRRTLGTAAVQKAPTLTKDIKAMVDATDAGIIGTRDRALILLGFAGAFRRSELVALTTDDCTFGKDGLTITIRRSKTDQTGEGRKIGHTLRLESRYVPSSDGSGMDRTSGHCWRAAVPIDQSAWQGTGRRIVRYRRGAGGEEIGTKGGIGCRQICRPFIAGGTCNQRSYHGCLGTVHHEPNRA
jgi:integrase